MQETQDIILLLLKDLRLKPALLTNRNLIKENGKFKGNYPSHEVGNEFDTKNWLFGYSYNHSK